MPDMASPFNALIAQNQQPAQNPLAMAGQVIGLQTGMAGAQRAGAEADDASLANAQNHLAYKIQALTPLLAKGANISAQDVAKAGADAVADSKGIVSSDEMAHFIGQLPTDGPGIQQALRQQQLRLIGAQNQIATLRGQDSDINTGAGTNFGNRNSFTGVRTPQAGGNGYVPNQPGVGLTEGPTMMTQTGPQATRMTNQQAYDVAQGKASVVGGRIVYQGGQGGAPAPAAPAPAATPAPGGRVPVGPAPPLNPDGSIPPQTGQLLPVGAPAGAAGAADVAAQGSANQGLQLQQAADQAPQARATIDNMKALLPKITTGPYAAGINRGKSIANELGQSAGVGNVFDPQTVAAQEEFHKQAEMLAQQSFQALGGTGTDRQLASAHGSNPNDALSGQGNAQILPMLEGLQDAVEAKASAWQKYRQTNGDASYGQFQTDFNKNFSPRAFQFVRMSPDQRQDLVKSMTPTERAQLGGALQNAETRGWIKPGG